MPVSLPIVSVVSALVCAAGVLPVTSAFVSSQPDSTASISSMFKQFTPDAFANGFSTLIGALVGTMFAYMLQRRFQHKLDHQADLMAAHRLMFSLLQQINTVILIQRDYVYDELKKHGRFISIPATPAFDTKKNVLELSELAFLLQEPESRRILYDFYIAQENYVEALNQWNLRSSFHLERLQPALAASGIPNGSAVTDEEMRKALGDQVYFHTINATDNCILTLNRAFQKLASLKSTIRSYLVRRFKTNDFTDFDFPETWGLTSDSEVASES